MSIAAFLWVILAAVLHAFWNFAAKKVSGNLSVIWLGVFITLFIMFPFVYFFAPEELFLAEVYPYILA